MCAREGVKIYLSFSGVKVLNLWLCLVGVLSDICFSGVSLLAADMINCQVTEPKQHTCLVLAVERKNILIV